MNTINHEFIERYQLLLQNNPSSKVFAPLAEAYRKMGLVKQAIEVCESGLKHNPDFASGYIALARAYMNQKNIEESLRHLHTACQLSPENLLAHELLAECYLNQKHTKKALKAYKMVLFLNPQHERATRAIKKLESLTADEYNEELFSMEKLNSAAQKMTPKKEELAVDLLLEEESNNEFIDRHISLIDAYLARNDHDKARKALVEAEKKMGPIPELLKRKTYILENKTWQRYNTHSPEPIKPISPQTTESPASQIEKLKELLSHIESRSGRSL